MNLQLPTRLVIGTAGHIDHGKTALVRALTGFDTDRLPEEKRRGITIELGFAPWPLTPTLIASVVDVPGHERFVHTMVAGAAGVDLALLVVAADDGVMPQTREHLDILQLLAVPQVILVLSKCDLVDDERQRHVATELKELCRSHGFADAPVVSTSARTGTGLDTLTAQVLALTPRLSPRIATGAAFLPLDRVFTVAGHGTVATGTLLQGRLELGDALIAWGESDAPLTELKVRNLQGHGKALTQAEAGMRVAVNLTGKVVDNLGRGMVLVPPNAFGPSHTLLVGAHLLSHAAPLGTETLRVHLGTTERDARVIPLGVDKLAPSANGGVLLRLHRPVAAFAGQHLVLRRPGVQQGATIAGGQILDPAPPSGRGSAKAARERLASAQGSPSERLLGLVEQARGRGLSRAQLDWRLPAHTVAQAIEALTTRKLLVQLPSQEERYVAAHLVDDLASRLVTNVRAHHAAQPLSQGVPASELENQLPEPERAAATIALAKAVAAGHLAQQGARITLPGQGASVDAKTATLLTQLTALYTKNPLAPPTDAEVVALLQLEKKRAHELLALGCKAGTLVRVAEAMHFLAASVASIQAALLKRLAVQHELSAAEFKELAGGLSRKFAIPLLEYFDRQKVTMRVGDLRRLHPSRRQGAPS